MRIDSYVNPTLVPRIQAAFDVSRVRISVQNHLHFLGHTLPDPLNRYSLDQTFPLDHNVSNVMLDGTLIGIDLWSKNGAIGSAENMTSNVRLKTRSGH